MEWYWVFAFLLGMLLFLMAVGVPVAISFMTTNVIGWLYFNNWREEAILQVIDNSPHLITQFVLGPVPMFVLMGALFFHTGLAVRVFDALDVIFGRIPGRLSYLTVAGGAVFSTLTGSSMANCAMLGSLMLPEMKRRGYDWRMSMGPILGTGGLAILIPPSGLAVLLASIAGIDVGKLLIAGLLPGLLLAVLYALLITVQLAINPRAAPAYDVKPASVKQKIRLVAVNIAPMSVVVFAVVGLILLGIATPTESAAFGVLAVLVLALVFRVLTLSAIRISLIETVRVGGMVFLIIMSATVFSQLLAFSGATSGMISWVTGYQASTLTILAVMFLVLVLLGMFMDPASIMLIVVPVFFPLAQALGFDLIWYGVFVMVTFEMAGITPPFGLLLYVLLGIAPEGTKLQQVSIAAFPYVLCATLLCFLLVVFPEIALFLPGIMTNR